MNISTHFDYNSHIVLISTPTKIGTPHKKAPVTVQTEVNLPIQLFSNVVANFLSTVVSKLRIDTGYKLLFSQGILMKHLVISKNLSWIRWFQAFYRAGGAGPVVQAMAGPIFETFQKFSSGYMLVLAGNIHACGLQAKSRRCWTNVA